MQNAVTVSTVTATIRIRFLRFTGGNAFRGTVCENGNETQKNPIFEESFLHRRLHGQRDALLRLPGLREWLQRFGAGRFVKQLAAA
jgi:hypothetical protein